MTVMRTSWPHARSGCKAFCSTRLNKLSQNWRRYWPGVVEPPEPRRQHIAKPRRGDRLKLRLSPLRGLATHFQLLRWFHHRLISAVPPGLKQRWPELVFKDHYSLLGGARLLFVFVVRRSASAFADLQIVSEAFHQVSDCVIDGFIGLVVIDRFRVKTAPDQLIRARVIHVQDQHGFQVRDFDYGRWPPTEPPTGPMPVVTEAAVDGEAIVEVFGFITLPRTQAVADQQVWSGLADLH